MDSSSGSARPRPQAAELLGLGLGDLHLLPGLVVLRPFSRGLLP